MAIEAILIDGATDFGGEPPVVKETETGYAGRKMWYVNTLDEWEALNAPGVPQRNWPYSANMPNLKVVDRETRRIGGVPRGDGTLEGGWSLVIANYATPGLNGRLPTPEENSAFTELEVATSSFQLTYDLRLYPRPAGASIVLPAGAPTVATTAPINGGRGLAVPRGLVQARVVHYLPAAFDVPRDRLVRLSTLQALNDNDIKLPNVNQGGLSWAVGKGKAQYVSWRENLDRGVRRIEHVLNLAEDFLYQWVPEDAQGNALQQDPIITVQHFGMDFTGIWPE